MTSPHARHAAGQAYPAPRAPAASRSGTAAEIRADPERLRHHLVDTLCAGGWIRSAPVEAAFRRVPRHLFTPGVAVPVAYADDIVIVRKASDGTVLSSLSAPSIQAMMLEQAGLRPGMRVLEIGSGGYNAALIAELVGPSGWITSIDLDPDITARARACLAAAGYRQILVAVTDGEFGYPGQSLYDRVLATAAAWDIPPAWTEQLTHDGTLTVPLRLRGLTRSVNLVRTGSHLSALSAMVCGFAPMQGVGAYDEAQQWLHRGGVRLRFDPGPDRTALSDNVWTHGPAQVWSGVTVRRMEPFDSLHLWLATSLGGFCLLELDDAVQLAGPLQSRTACPALVDGPNLAYLTLRQHTDDTHEFGAAGYGLNRAELAATIVHQVRRWHTEQRTGPGPRITVHPAHAPAGAIPDGFVLTKRHTQVNVSWPGTDHARAYVPVRHTPR